MVAAQRAKIEHFASPPSNVVHANLAKDLLAMGALIGSLCIAMTRAHQRPVGQHDRRGRSRWRVKFGDRYCYIGGFYEEFDVTEEKSLAGVQAGLCNPLSSD